MTIISSIKEEERRLNYQFILQFQFVKVSISVLLCLAVLSKAIRPSVCLVTLGSAVLHLSTTWLVAVERVVAMVDLHQFTFLEVPVEDTQDMEPVVAMAAMAGVVDPAEHWSLTST